MTNDTLIILVGVVLVGLSFLKRQNSPDLSSFPERALFWGGIVLILLGGFLP